MYNEKPIWNGKTLTFDLDHINGDNTDNRIENLRFLCPNCHSQTETYKGKNRKIWNDSEVELCLSCKEISTNGKYCKACKKKDALPPKRLTDKEKLFFLNKLPDHEIVLMESKRRSFNSLCDKYDVPQSIMKSFLNNKDLQSQILNKSKIKRQTTIAYPPIDELIKRFENEGYESLSRELKVSGNAIRKHLNNRLGFTPKRQKHS